MDEMKRLEFKLFLKDLVIEKFVEEGRVEERTNLIKNLFTFGMSAETIVKATGLPEEEVSKILADEMPNNSEV